MPKLSSGLRTIYGASLLLGVCLIKGPYRGPQIAHMRAQRNNSFHDGAIKQCLEGFLASAFVEQHNYLQQKDADRLTQLAKEQYSDAGLSGYADDEWSKGGATLPEQQRGQVLSALAEAIRTLPPHSTLVELGTGNGDVAAHIAREFPESEVVGVDFITATAEKKHSSQENLKWVAGYALDLFETGKLRPDLVWGSSIFCLLPPRELRRYILCMRDSGTRLIVLNEPSWGKLDLGLKGIPRSVHLEGLVWHHDYPALLTEFGYRPTHQTFNPYKHPLSPRTDIRLAIGAYEVC